ncbi:DUF421 domain-containing protein [Alkalihalobacillus pseudalcaliphilus]|uniref:DUF421 domain-containing protein n=1 Tax=Alkalihalobacillus pseudalcaliphilus TaxID=79884 RepID=UPI00064DC2F9|nr:DUF421 domain-containing protein [Alkalihalobacillus pseudalcaliphilus]KMK76147.1 membrane protein [Alkalihalobacillus pseudalcaliphilus]
MNMNFVSLTVELLIGFFALLALTKFLGKNQITQLTPFDFISALVLGELVGNAIYDPEIGLHYVLYAICFWGALIFFIEMITQKIRESRALLEGKPSLIIVNGKIQYEELKKNKLDLNQLQHLLREKDVFSIREVQNGILETNGTLSVMKKFNYNTPKNEDLRIPAKSSHLPIALIMDGEIIYESLNFLNRKESWLMDELLRRGIAGPTAVLYADWIENEGFEIQKY